MFKERISFRVVTGERRPVPLGDGFRDVSGMKKRGSIGPAVKKEMADLVGGVGVRDQDPDRWQDRGSAIFPQIDLERSHRTT